ncbi:MAG: hypothetical protein Fur0015_13650 [Ignavibacteriales bacterium]
MKNIKIILLILISSSIFSQAQNFSKLDELMNQGIESKLFPGGVLLVGDANKVLYNKAFGNFTYDKNSPEVKLNTMFDMASVTKVFATTMCIMKLYDENKIDLKAPLSKYFPEYSFGKKDEVKVIDLLIHESGLPAYYSPNSGETRTDVIDTVLNKKLVYEKNTKMIYSCLNFVTTMLLVERITGKPMMEFYKENFTSPLKLNRTMFVPPSELRNECAPTEGGLQGIVHDPLARSLEGKSGNAGLFSTAEDLAKMCKMILNDGKCENKQIIKKETLQLFTKKYSDRSSRAIGFDTKSDNGYTSAGKLFSPNSFGHTGYTGTSIWIDPERKIYVVLLTNRVYPDDSATLHDFRPMIHDAVIEAIGKE